MMIADSKWLMCYSDVKQQIHQQQQVQK